MSGNAPNLPEGMEYCDKTDGCFTLVPGGGDCGAIHCPGCGQPIAVSEDSVGFTAECGGVGEGSCDACFDESNLPLLESICAAQGEAVRAYVAELQAGEDPDILCLLTDAEENA
jgi:hypothetical protein